MSSKNQSESAATAPENIQENISEIEEVKTDFAEGNNLELVEESQGKSNATEYQINDRRRLDQEHEDEAGEDDGTDSADVFEIDLDQMKMETEVTEREIADLRAQLKETEDRLKESEVKYAEAIKISDEYADRFRKAQLQLRAETDEVRARMQRNFDQKLEIARGDVLIGLLDTLDNLQRAVAAAETVNDQGAAFEALRDGVRATSEMFESQLKKIGLQAVISEGEPFNPEIHDAVEIASTSKDQDNMVLAELQRGYKFGDRLLRPARVRVGRAD